jgi:hypothetical protein
MVHRVPAIPQRIIVDLPYRVRFMIQTVPHVIASTVQLYSDHPPFFNTNGQFIASSFGKSGSEYMPPISRLTCIASRSMLPRFGS